ARLRPAPADADGRDAVRPLGRFDEGASLREEVRETADEGVARARRVDGLDRLDGDAPPTLGVDDEAAARAEREDDRARAAVEQLSCRRLLVARDRAADEQLGLGLVRAEDVAQRVQLGRQL